MVKIREFTEAERLEMYKLKNVFKMDYRTIAERFKCSASGAHNIVHRIENKGTARNQLRTGRKRCTTQRTDRKIKNSVNKNRKLTAKEIKDLISREAPDISVRTIGNRLTEQKFFGGFARKKPMISEKNRKARLEFAKKYVNMPPEFWKKILWSDESKFEIINSKRRVRVYKVKGERLTQQTIQPTVKHSKSITVWGCVAASGIGELVEISGLMDAKQYVDILTNNLIKSAQKLKIKDHFIFQSDNDPKHTSKKSKEWLAQNLIECLEWPSQSPDLNIIENLWEYLDRQIEPKFRKSIKDFKTAIFREWKNIPKELIDKCIESIPRRLQAVIKANGLNTNY
jgi:transposase